MIKHIIFNLSSAITIILLFSSNAYAISKEKHGNLTHAAFSEYKKCISSLNKADTLSEGKTEIIKATSMEDEFPLLKRYFNWHFYDEYRGTKYSMGSSFTGANKSLHKIYADRIDSLLFSITNNDQSAVYEYTGRVLHYIQDMTVPAHVAPIYHYKFLFIDNSDYFDEMPEWETNDFKINQDFCEIKKVDINDAHNALEELLQKTASETRSRIRSNINAPIGHRLSGKTWEEFWVIRNPKNDDNYSGVKSGFAPYGNEKREGFKRLCEEDKGMCLDFFSKSYSKALSSTVKAMLLVNELNIIAVTK